MDLQKIFRRKKKTPDLLPVRKEVPRPSEGLTHDNLRKQLFAAAASAARGDDQKLLLLCHRHGRTIFGESAVWSHVPKAFRGSPQLLAWYRDGLKIIASFYSDRLGRPEVASKMKNPTEA